MTTLVLEHLQHADSSSPDITIDSSGRVGIGTTSPGSQLTVQGTLGDGSSQAYIDGWSIIGNSYQGNIMTKLNWAGGGARIQGYNSGVQKFEISANSDTYFNGGNVGIGTDSPSTTASGYDGGTLHVHNAGTGSSIRLTNATTGTGTSEGMLISKWNDRNTYFTNFDTGTNMVFTPTNSSNNLVSNAFVIKSDGNIGIGTDNPQEHLHIQTTSPALKLTDTGNGGNNLKISQGYNSYLTASNNVYMSAGGSTDMLNLIGGAVQVKKTRAGTISGGASDTGAVIKLHTEAQWESGYGNNALATTNDYLGGIEFHTGDSSTGEGLRAAIRGTVDSYYNQNSIVFETAVGATAAEPIERMRVWHNGQVTMPYQPCFGAILGAHINASNYLTGWTAQTNVGSHFNAGDGTFTAPVTGQYYFYVSVMRATNDSGDYSVQIRKNGSSVRISNDMANGSYITYMQTTVPAVLTLSANDNIRFYIGNTVSTSYAYQGTYTHCGGYLIG